MKQFLLGVFVLIGFSVSAQLNIEPNPIEVVDSHTAADIQVDFTVENMNSDDEAPFLWRFASPENFPEDWHVHICDMNLCYFHTVHTCPDSNPNTLAASASAVFQLHVNPRGQQAEYMFTFELFSIDDVNTVLSTIEVTVSTLTSSTNEESLTQGLDIYPNPTVESFQIKNDENVKTVAIYNIVGKQIQQFTHSPGDEYKLSTYRKGMYLVRLFDNSGKSLKALRLSKK